MKNSENITESNSKIKYFCPMKCENDKVYYQPGNCPVCNMHLVPVDKNKIPEEHDHHEHTPPKDENHETGSHDKYYCTMLCEGDKTYPEPADCPVCGMHLKKVESISPSGTIYTCPMHPEIRADKPGSCPKCGMTLVPEKGVETSEEENAYRKMAQKF